jgi:hypothetical protein
MPEGMRVEVVGLKDLRRELKKLEEDDVWRPELRNAGLAAGEIVATEARRTAAAGQTTRAGKHATMGHEALATIRTLAQQTRVFVAGGSERVVWFKGWEGLARAKQFPPATADGYNIYPAIERKRSEVIESYMRAPLSASRRRRSPAS